MAEAHRGKTTASAATFGALVRRYRLAAALSQEALAERAGLSAEAISVIERGKRGTPRLETVALLADALDLPSAARATFIAASRAASGSAALDRQPTADLASSTPGDPPFVGRAQELALLERHAAGEGPPVLFLAGEPGIGKSRLLGEAMTVALRAGWTVLQGGCQRRSGQEPYAPLLGALKSYVRRQAPTQLQAELHGCAWLVRLLPELADGPIEPLPAWTLPLEQERRLMFEAVSHLLTNIGGVAGTLLALDDLQWAESDALELLASVVRATEAPVRVVGTYRDTEVRPRDPLAVTLADLAHAGLAAQHMLAPLTPPDCARLLAALLPEGRTAPDSTVQAALRERVLRRAGGVPFFVVSCAQEWRAGLLGGTAGDAAPWTVAQSVRQRVAALPEGARAVLDVAAVAGRAVPAAVLLAVATQPQDDVLAALEAACQARLLVDEEPGYRFAHDVIREVIEGDIGSARRLLLHGRIAQVLEHSVQQADVEVLAYHYSRSGEHDKALLYLEQAGDRARDRYAHEAAAVYYREVATRLDGLGRAPAAARMREQAGELLQTAGQYEQALALLEQAAEGYQAADDLEGLGRAVAFIGKVHMLAGSPAPLQRLEQTLARLEEHGVRRGIAVVCAALADLYRDAGRFGEQLAAAERAVECARALGDDRMLAAARAERARALLCCGRQEDVLPDLEEAVRLADSTGQLAILCEALMRMAALVYGNRGEVERSRAYSDRAVATAERLGDPALLVLMLAIHGLLAFYHGDWRHTRADCERALAVMNVWDIGPILAGEVVPLHPAVPRWQYGTAMPQMFLGQLCLAEGNWTEAGLYLEAAAHAAVHRDDVLTAQSLLAHFDLLVGRPAAAYARLAHLAAQPGPREDWEWRVTPPLVLLAWAHLDLDEVVQAADIVAQAVTRARATHQPLELVESLWMQARVATRQQHWVQARRALDEGVALARRMRYPYGEARLLHVYGTLHMQQADLDRARTQLEAALVIFRRLGARTDAESVEQAMIALGDNALPLQ